MLELAFRVQRIHADRDQAGTQDAEQRHRVLQQIWHHDRDPLAFGEPKPTRQIGGEVARPALGVGIGEPDAEIFECNVVRVALCAHLHHLSNARERQRTELHRNAGRIVLRPRLKIARAHRF
jgi:hypothetical protein